MSNYPQMCLWIDPGGTTGFAWVWHTPEGYFFHCEQRTGTEDAAAFVDTLLAVQGGGLHDVFGTVWVGWEQYIVTSGGGRAGNPAPALEVIGAVKWLCRSYGARVLPPVPASHRTVCSKDILESMGWYQPGMPHAMDAARHLGAWIMREQQRIRMAEKCLQELRKR